MVMSYIVMRNDEHEEGTLRIERALFADAGGKLEEFIGITRGNGEPLVATDNSYQIDGTADRTLDTLDDQWQRLQAEFADINDEAAYYYFAKKGVSTGSGLEKFQRQTTMSLSGRLLDVKLSEKEMESGEIDEKRFPITVTSHRMDAMRNAADNADIELDAFEKAIDKLSTNTYASADKFDDILDGNTGEDDEEDNELQLATGGDTDDETGEGKDWGQVNPDLDTSDMEEMSEEELDAVPAYQDTPQGPRNSWEDDDFDPDDERDNNLREEMNDYVNYMVDFTNVANQLWMNSLMRITDGDHVQLDEDAIHEMETIRQHAKEAYDILKEQAAGLGTAAYELKPVFEEFEDPKHGTLAMMDKIIRMTSKPKQLEAAIRKGTTPAQKEPEPAPEAANDNGMLREGEYQNGKIKVTRELFMDNKGLLHVELGMFSLPDNILVKAAEWTFHPGGRMEPLIDNLDAHWDKLCEELDIISKQGRAYGLIKSRGNADKADNVAQRAVYYLADNLLNQRLSDRQYQTRDYTDDMPPLTTINQRYKTVREVGDEMDMKNDSFENSIIRLSTDMHDAMNQYDDIRMGMNNQPPADMAGAGGGGDDFHSGNEHDEDKPKWEPEPADKWKKNGDDLPASEWQKERDKEEDHQDRKENMLVGELLDQLNGFMGAADQIWMQAGTQLSKGEKVSVPAKQLEMLRYWMAETDEAYTRLEASTRDMPDHYKLHDIFEGLEDEKDGFKAQMQKIVSIASRPDLLEDTIQKALPRQHKM